MHDMRLFDRVDKGRMLLFRTMMREEQGSGAEKHTVCAIVGVDPAVLFTTATDVGGDGRQVARAEVLFY